MSELQTKINTAKERLKAFEPSDPFVKHPITDKVYEITYVLNGWGLKNGYVVFGIREVKNDL